MISDSDTAVADPPEEGLTAEELERPEMTPAQRKEHEHYEAIKAKTTEVHRLRSEYAAAKDDAKETKKAFEAANTELLAMIRRGPDMQQTLPMDGGEQATDGEQPGLKPGEMALVGAKEENDEWRSVEVGELEISDAIVNKLLENNLGTLGDLSDFWKACKSLTDLKGIGEAKSSAVSDAFAKYGTEHPEIFETVADEAAAETPVDDEPANVNEADDDDEEEDWDLDDDDDDVEEEDDDE